MASYATVAEEANDAKDDAVAAKNTAVAKATEATTAAATANTAKDTATSKATEATTAASTATTKANEASASAQSIAESAAQIQENTDSIDQLMSEFTDYADGYVHILESDFSRGSLNNDGSINTGQSYYASTNKDMIYDRPVNISVKSGYKYIYREKTGDSAYNNSGWLTTDITVLPNKAFKLQIGRVTETWGAADLGIFSKQINVTSADSTGVAFNSAKIEQLEKGNELLVFAFVRGSVTGTGEYVSYVNYRVSTPDIISYDRDITITADDGFKFSGCTYAQDGTLIESWGSWMTERKVSAGQRIRLVIIRATEDTSEVADVFEFYTKIHIQSEFKDYVDAVTANPNTALLTAPIFANGRAKLIAHMGYHATAPENTTEAYKEAGKMGFWGIESDVQQTSDGYYVMMHDSTVDRTTNGSGAISSMTLAEIRALHIKDRPDLQVPTFEEYLSICKRYGCVPNIELKGTITNTKASYEKIIGIVKQYAFSDKSVIFCGSKWALSNFRQATASIPFMAIYQYNSSYNWDTEFAFCSGYDNVGMCWDIGMNLTLEQCKQAHDNDMIIDAFITDTEADVSSAFAVGADFVTTNTITPTD
jgi:glycerophosphoryl diester phosphodiesterase